MELENSVDPVAYAALLTAIRRRRWFLWTLILGYLPATVGTLKLTQSTRPAFLFFAVWVVLLFVAVTLLAIARCPRCGKNYHMRNSTLSFFGKCRHCGLDPGNEEKG